MRIALFLIAIFLGLRSQAQVCSYSLSGLVEDQQGNRLPGASVSVFNNSVGASTELNGSFLLHDLCAGEYRIIVSFVGFEEQQLSVRIPSQRFLVVKLKSSTSVLHDIVIEGDHVQQHGLTQSVSLLTERELQSMQGRTLGDVLNQLPGVNSLSSGPGILKPVIHGLHSQRILILNNGIRQEGQQWGLEHAPEIDPYIASEIEVVKGAEAVRYGADAMGGVVILNAAPLHYSTSIGGEANLAMFSNNRMGVFSGMLEGGINSTKNIGWRVQGTLKKGGDYHAPDYNLSNTGVEERNLSTTFGIRREKFAAELYMSTFNSTIGILRSSHTGNLGDLQRSIVTERPWFVEDFSYTINNPKQEIAHHLLKAKARVRITDNNNINITYGGQYNQREEYDIRRGGRSGRPSLSLNLITHTADVSYDHASGARTGSLGVSTTFKNNSVSNTGVIPIIPVYDQLIAGLYVLEKYILGEWLVEGGIRYDHQQLEVRFFDENNVFRKPSYNFNYFAAYLGIAKQWQSTKRFTSHLGISSRPPHVSELFSRGLHHGAAAIEYGLLYPEGRAELNKAVKQERSFKWVNSYQYMSSKGSMELTGYINLLNDYVYLRPYGTQLTTRGYFPVFQYRQTQAVLTGGDVLFNKLVTQQINYGFRGAYVYAKDISNHNRLLFIPPPTLENSLTYTINSVKRWRDLYVKVALPVVFKQDHAPQTILPEDVQPGAIQGPIFDFMDAPKGYALVHVEFGARLPFENQDLTITLGVENAANTSYRNYMNRLRYFTDEPGRNITLRIKYAFHSHH